ncbi:hypothetical protein DFO73_10424 [Cytobacillus oceanisediminis]|uniref:Uncharacterized protein n=1 Tax=Cytobacillus oceanisediminis TaxID=665099 RepID=A0A2V3A0E4_9BACI|nr:hypothetical protein [Cytobacillus oceanisediminis]PWW29393.1 hypothetical protein DFO73_10424 [Cytobacillus oceanisediminis]
MALGAWLGLFVSYGIVILMRFINNSLTSFFYLDFMEKSIMLIGILLAAILGNAAGKRKLNKKEA